MSSLRPIRRPVIGVVVAALTAALAVVLGPATAASAAVEKPLTLGYDQQVYGDFLLAGNAVNGCPTSGTPASDCQTAAGRSTPADGNNVNDNFFMTAVGADPANGIFNSSSASITIPSGATVDYAQLVWAGDTGVFKGSTITKCAPSSNVPATLPPGSPSSTPVQLEVGANAAVSVTANRLTTDTIANITNAQYYSAAANVTALFANAPTGSALTVKAANVWAPQGYNCFGGWSIIVVFKFAQANPAAPVKREVFLYDGHVRQATTDSPTTTTITGFRANGQATVGVVAYEGDWGISGDQFQINGAAQTDPQGPGAANTNFFTSYAQGRVGDTSVNNYSIDAKTLDVSTSVIKTGDTAANLTFTTSGDSYLAEELVMSVPVPELNIAKSVTPAVSHAGDTLTWTITVTNPSVATATNVAVTDSLVPSCNKTIGVLAGGGSMTYTCTSTSPSASFVNTANVTGTDNFNSPLTGTATAPETVINPAIAITKTADQPSYHVGDTVTYTITVKNTGDTNLSGVAVTDATTASCVRTIGTLAAGASTSYTCTDTAPVPGNANTAAASGKDQLTKTVTATSTVPVPVIHPSLSLTKSATPGTVTAAGQSVTYSFLVTNTGDTTITGLSIADSPVSPSGPAPPISCPTTTLTVGASTTCTGTYPVTQADVDNGTIKNNAVANGKDPLNKTVTSNTSSATVNVTRTPALTLTKTATPTTVSAIGAPVSYSFLVKNTGNVTVTGLTVADVFDNPAVVPPAIACPATTLAPGDSVRCTATYNATQSDFDQGSINNTATASGKDASNAAVTSNPSSASVTASVAPSITLVKSVSPTTVTAAGQPVTYSFLVTNTGNQTLFTLTIDDTLTSPAGPALGVSCPNTTLLPGGTTTCTAAYTVTQADVDNGTIKNSAIARSTTSKGTAVNSAQSNAIVTVTQRPSLALVKTATPSTISGAGQHVSYAFAVTNTGNVTIKNLSIADQLAAPAGPALTISCPVTTLAPGTGTTCTAGYTATQADVDNGNIKNSATAIGTDPSNTAVTSPIASATVAVTRSPRLTLVKSATPTTVSAVNQTVTYSFLVTNAGNETITSLAVTDTLAAPAGPELTVSCPTTTLAPAASTTCTATYQVIQADLDNGWIDNSAVAKGVDPANATVASNTSTATVTATTAPSLTLVKAASPTTYASVGQSITYTFTVTNTGNTTASSLAINDPMFTGASAPACAVTTLAPGASTTCTATYQTTQGDLDSGKVTNTATATARDPKNKPITSNPSSATVTAAQNPSLRLAKSALPTTVAAVGDIVTYTFTVQNTGNVTIANLSINDAFTAPAGPPLSPITCAATTLAPTDTTTCTATYAATQADLNNGSINNSARATGKDPGNATVTSNQSTATVGVTNAPRLTLVKTASPTTVTAAGATVTYTFEVSNSGNVTITGLAISDTFTAPAGPPIGPITCGATTLLPGDTTTCTATYTAPRQTSTRARSRTQRWRPVWMRATGPSRPTGRPRRSTSPRAPRSR